MITIQTGVILWLQEYNLNSTNPGRCKIQSKVYNKKKKGVIQQKSTYTACKTLKQKYFTTLKSKIRVSLKYFETHLEFDIEALSLCDVSDHVVLPKKP